MVPFTGASVALWGSDYPHAEGTYPHSQDVVADFAKGLSEKDVSAITFDTAADLFGFDRAKLLEPI